MIKKMAAIAAFHGGSSQHHYYRNFEVTPMKQLTYKALGAIASFCLIAAACTTDPVIVDAGENESVVAFEFTDTGGIEILGPPEVDGLSPAVKVDDGFFPLILEQCVIEDAIEVQPRIWRYSAARQWTSDDGSVDYSDEILGLELDGDLIAGGEGEGCSVIPVLQADIPPAVADQVKAAGVPVLIQVEVDLTFNEPKGIGSQTFGPFWLVP